VAQPKVKLMRREAKQHQMQKVKPAHPQSSAVQSERKTIEQKEREYAALRAQIMGAVAVAAHHLAR
jgi:hypothetical protein